MKDQAFKLSRHNGNRSQHSLGVHKDRTLEKYQSNSFSRLCPTDSLLRGCSVINTPPSSKVPQMRARPRSQSSKLLLRAPDHQYSQKCQKCPETRTPRVPPLPRRRASLVPLYQRALCLSRPSASSRHAGMRASLESRDERVRDTYRISCVMPYGSAVRQMSYRPLSKIIRTLLLGGGAILKERATPPPRMYKLLCKTAGDPWPHRKGCAQTLGGPRPRPKGCVYKLLGV